MFRSLLVVGLIMSASAASAQDAENAAAPAKPVKEKKICKVEDGGTTSRMRRRVCRTVKEWSEPRENGGMDELRRVGGQ